mgnify:CR=1 FL=1
MHGEEHSLENTYPPRRRCAEPGPKGLYRINEPVAGHPAGNQVEFLCHAELALAVDQDLAGTLHGAQASLEQVQFVLVNRESGRQFLQRRNAAPVAFHRKDMRTRTQAQWCELLEGTDACFAPVLTLAEASGHAHARERSCSGNSRFTVASAPAAEKTRLHGMNVPSRSITPTARPLSMTIS